MSYYDILGVDSKASLGEIKKAFRERALRLHPDTAERGRVLEDDAAFKRLTEAYEVLRDDGRRAAYDGLHTDGPDFTGAGRWRGEADIDEWFAEWFKRQGFGPTAEEEFREQRREAQRVAAAAAWEAEKAEARVNRERGARLRARADAARALRHARVLRRFWHTSAGLVWQDAAVMALLAASAGGAVALWPAPRPPLEDAAAGAREE